MRWKTVAVASVSVGSALIAWDVLKKRRSNSHTLSTALKHYLVIHLMKRLGAHFYRKLDEETKSFSSTQDKFLLDLIQKNKDTAYGIDHRFDKINSREAFVANHPLTKYDNYKPYVDQLTKGNQNVLTSVQPVLLALTSGTSGTCNLVPTVREIFTIFFKGVAVLYHVMLQYFPDISNLQRNLKIFYTPKPRSELGGIPVGPNSSNPKNSKSVWCMYSTPPPAFDILNEQEALYIHLLFALKDENLGMIECNFISLAYNAFQTLQKVWPQICLDIESGMIDPDLKIDPEIRKQLQKYMSPDLQRSAKLRQEFQQGFDGIARRIWPNMYMILSVDTGSFELYGRLLQNQELSGIPVFSPVYAATEGLIGLNLNPLSAKREYLLVPHAMFYEFIPIGECSKENPQTLFGDQVKVGELYELVITTKSGLYRYRFGDVVRISSIYNQCPKVEFMYRQGQLLNVRGEKTSESVMFSAMSEASKRWQQETGGLMVDYCCAESVLTDQKGAAPYYIIFVEMNEKTEMSKDSQAVVDEILCQKNNVYQSFRTKGSIAPTVVHFVQPGTFSRLRDLLLQTTDASVNQYKVPRRLCRKNAVDFMMENTY